MTTTTMDDDDKTVRMTLRKQKF